MVDVIKTITEFPTVIETRLLSLELLNRLDSNGNVGDPGKYQVTLKTVDESQLGTRELYLYNGMPIRTLNTDIVFDPMIYKDIQITRPDGTTFLVGEVLCDLTLTIDLFKAGLPILPTVIEEPVLVAEEPPTIPIIEEPVA